MNNLFKLEDKETWEKILDALPYATTILSPELKIIRTNKAAASLFNLENHLLEGKYCHEVFNSCPFPCKNCPATASLSKEVDYQEKLIFNEKLEKTVKVTSTPVFDHDGKLSFLVHTARDVSTQIKTNAERLTLSAATEQSTESIIIADLEGTIEYVNPSFCRISGFGIKEVVGKNLRFLTLDSSESTSFDTIWSTITKGHIWRGRLNSRKKDGTYCIEDATFSPIFDNNKSATNYLAVKRDITREEQLQRQLQQAIKMEAIGTLAGGIAHDFNNILSAMIGYGQIAKGRLASDDPLLGDIEQILKAGDRAANLVKQILTFSRRDTQENFYPIQIQFIIKEVLTLLRSSIPTTIELQQNVQHDCAPILADPGQIHQVIMNLYTNAKQAIGNDYGAIIITLEQIEKHSPQILGESSLLTSGAYLHLMVEDTGCGMDEDLKSRIFDPFFTTKPIDQGTGLGLSVVHGIVKKHGGEISVETIKDLGTTFHVYLPVVQEEAASEIESTDTDIRGSERIMIVDDEVVLARVLQRMLAKQGYEVTLFTDSIKAVREYTKRPYDFDAVVTDMTMPNMTGAELAKEFLSLRPDLPIIMTTGFSESIDREKATEIGIVEFLYKPIKKKELTEVVRKVLDNRS